MKNRNVNEIKKDIFVVLNFRVYLANFIDYHKKVNCKHLAYHKGAEHRFTLSSNKQ